ncbi:Crp/Fnr family transcriptional regulator [Mucilaginibacter glaciei]|uniref:Crp/Fnr family transcriptional regulator n=1 Tax=Mucilaginibacter glaciei TaxID=2772109 RepID=A0A926NR07_9SPHI|nr:Crp/Fnr family transcriptional regulator [Mucilaginibacter glaciei]MBD1393125.1 Crp/Fnr family transcriptional regulator [Mucilaginibacter glaciei]
MDEITNVQLSAFRAGIAPFIVFNEAEWIVFIQHISIKTYKKKQHFAEAGKVCNYFGFILTGSVRYYHLVEGNDVTGYFSFENEFTSSYKSFLTATPAINYIQALEPTQIVIITKKNMDLMLANPMLAYKMERFGRLIAEHYLICYEDRVASFVTQTPEERYLKLLETGREVLQRMPQHYIANFLGITPVSLSRIRKRILSPS